MSASSAGLGRLGDARPYAPCGLFGPKSGRTWGATTGKRERLEKAIKYLDDNKNRLDYKRFREMDLELASGMVEGAIKHIIGHRFDHGGMRWIRERAEALLQLRCIEINGDWDHFIQWVHDKRRADALAGCRSRLRRGKPAPLPTALNFDIRNETHAKAA